MWEEKLVRAAGLLGEPTGAPWRVRPCPCADPLWALGLSVSTGRGNHNKKEADTSDPFALVFTESHSVAAEGGVQSLLH